MSATQEELTMTAEDGLVVCWRLLIAAADLASIPPWRPRRRRQQERLFFEASRLFDRLLDAAGDAVITIPARPSSPLATTYHDVKRRRDQR